MEIANKERPTKEDISFYKEKIEYFLQAHNLKIEVILKENPIEMQSWWNKEPHEHKNIWLDGVKLKNDKVEDLYVPLYGTDNVSKDINKIWHDCFEIQNAYYRELNIQPKNPNEGDLYWNLWNLRKEQDV